MIFIAKKTMFFKKIKKYIDVCLIIYLQGAKYMNRECHTTLSIEYINSQLSTIMES